MYQKFNEKFTKGAIKVPEVEPATKVEAVAAPLPQSDEEKED